MISSTFKDIPIRDAEGAILEHKLNKMMKLRNRDIADVAAPRAKLTRFNKLSRCIPNIREPTIQCV